MVEEKQETLVHKELSYQIIGVCFSVWNELGNGHKEKFIQRAIETELVRQGLHFKREVPATLRYKGITIGHAFLDFLIEDTVVVEIKVGERFKNQDYIQVKNYLTQFNKELGLLIRFGQTGVFHKRILKPYAFLHL